MTAELADALRQLAAELADELANGGCSPFTVGPDEITLMLRSAADLLDTPAMTAEVQTRALRLIITHCPTLAPQAATVIGEPAEDGEQRQRQINRMIMLALRTGMARTMTDAERMQLATAIAVVP